MKKILIVIDFQNDFVTGSLGFSGAELLDRPIAEKIRQYGKGNVFYTLDTHEETYLNTREGKNLPVVHCIKNTHGWEVFGETGRALKDVEAVGFCKNSFGLDISDDVFKKLPKEADEIELVGLVSNICVLSNAVVFQTKYPNAAITVDASLTKSADPKPHEAALDVLQGLQVNVINK